MRCKIKKYKRDIDTLLRERVLERKWKINTKALFLKVVDMNGFDYAILLYAFERSMELNNPDFLKTNMMWDLNLTPSFYSRLSESVDKLVSKGFILEKCISRRPSLKNPRMSYSLSPPGHIFCESFTKIKK